MMGQASLSAAQVDRKRDAMKAVVPADISKFQAGKNQHQQTFAAHLRAAIYIRRKWQVQL